MPAFFIIITKISRPPEYFYEYLNMQYVKRMNRASTFELLYSSFMHSFLQTAECGQV